MVNLKTLASADILMIWELSKLIKASKFVYYSFEEDNIAVYGIQDAMFSTISRIVVLNNTAIRGTLTLDVSFFNAFCKGLIPFMDVKVDSHVLTNTVTNESCLLSNDVEHIFIEKKSRLNESLTNSVGSFPIGSEIKDSLKQSISAMRASTGQRFFELADGYLITIYAGVLPLNKADNLNIDVLYSNSSFLCKYEVLKKKAPAPIHVFINYRRL